MSHNFRFITACNLKQDYLEFVEPWINHHKRLYPNCEVKVILVAHSIPAKLELVKEDIILYEPEVSIPTAYIAQMIRILYPVLLEPAVNIMCDIDLFIMNTSLLTLIKSVPNLETAFINYGKLNLNSCVIEKQLAFCYSILHTDLIKSKYEVRNRLEIDKFLLDNIIINKNGYKWETDQIILYERFWNYEGLVKIEREKPDRLDRNWFNYKLEAVKEAVKNNVIVDYHAPRPYSRYSEEVDTVLGYCPPP